MRNLQITALLLLVALLFGCLLNGCTSDVAGEDTRTVPAGAVVTSAATPFPIPSSVEPEGCEIVTIQIDSTVGLFSYGPNDDVTRLLESMEARIVDNGLLYEKIILGG